MEKITKQHILLIFILGIITYCNIFQNEFVFDDLVLITKNENIKHFRYIPNLFSGEFFDIDMRFNKGGYYRPLILLSFMFDYSIWKLNPLGFHLTNLLFHLGNALLVYFIIRKLFAIPLVALVTALLFTIHPVQTGAVTYISGRTDLLATFFILGAFFSGILSYQKDLSSKKQLFSVLVFTCFTLGLLSKEIAIIFPVLLLLYLFIFQKENLFNRQSALFFSCLTIEAILYLILRSSVLKSFEGGLLKTVLNGLPLRLFMIPKILIQYLFLLIAPLELHFERFTLLPSSLTNYLSFFASWFYVLLFIGILILSITAYKKRPKMFFGIAWFFIAIAPGAQLIPIIISNRLFTPEHFLYLPSIGIFLIFALSLERFLNKHIFKNFIIFFLCLIATLFIFRALQRNTIFKNTLSFYQDTLAYSPSSARIHNNLGNTYFDRGEFDKALEEYQKALKIDPTYGKTHVNIGNLYTSQKKFDQALQEYLKAAKLNPFEPTLWLNIGVTYHKQNNDDEAEKALKKAISIKPNYKEVYDNLGTIYHTQGLSQKALEAYEKALKISPRHAKTLYHIGNVYMQAKDYTKAIIQFNLAIKYEKDLVAAYNNLGIAYQYTGQLDKAISTYQKALKYQSNNLSLHNNLGAAFDKKGLLEQALKEFYLVKEKDPNDPACHYNIGNILLKKKENQKALKELLLASQLDPKDIDIALSLSFAYTQLGKKDNALAELKRISAIYPQNQDIKHNLNVLRSKKN